MTEQWKAPSDPNDPWYPLRRPACYPLSVCLRELKWSRPAAEQRWLDERIEELTAWDGLDSRWADFGEAARDSEQEGETPMDKDSEQ